MGAVAADRDGKFESSTAPGCGCIGTLCVAPLSSPLERVLAAASRRRIRLGSRRLEGLAAAVEAAVDVEPVLMPVWGVATRLVVAFLSAAALAAERMESA